MTRSFKADIEILRLFNQKTDELLKSSFVQSWDGKGAGILHLTGGPFRVVREGGPTSDSLKAFLLTFRLFVSDRDGISLRLIRKLYDVLPVTPDCRSQIANEIVRLDQYLDEASPLIVNGSQIVRRDLLLTWLYGVEAHLNRDQRERLKQWTVEDDVSPFFAYEFEVIVLRVLNSISAIASINGSAIGQLTEQQTSQ